MMNCTAEQQHAPPPARHPGRRRGFSFIEILFAVMILGIGFIMIAGIFPVAISQTAATQDETIAATLGRNGIGVMSNLPAGARTWYLSDITNWPKVNRLEGALYTLVKGNQILREDPRYAFIPLLLCYRDASGQPAPTAQAIIVPVQVRGRSQFNSTDLNQAGAGAALFGTLSPVLV